MRLSGGEPAGEPLSPRRVPGRVKTYLSVLFNADGDKPSAISEALGQLGFAPMQGAHDFVYDWPGAATVEEVLGFGDRIHAELAGTGCLWSMETV